MVSDQLESDISYLIVYAKVNDDKKDGMQFRGPFYGKHCKTEQEAKKESRKLVNESRNSTIIPKIMEIKYGRVHNGFVEAQSYFKSLENRMRSAEEVLSRPVIKRKKKKRK